MSEVSDSALLCRSCGTNLIDLPPEQDGSSNAPDNTEKSRKARIIRNALIIIFAVILVAVVAIFGVAKLSESKLQLADKYYNGDGEKQDYAKAMEYYKKAADMGNSKAMNNIGEMYKAGNGVVENYTKAMEWYKKAADKGNAVAMSNIADMYEFGWGVEKDYEMARSYRQMAKDNGYTG